MIKLGCNFLSLRDTGVEEFIRICYDLRLDVVDFHQQAFQSTDPAYLTPIKLLCLRYGLPIGYIGVSGLFHGTAEERRLNTPPTRNGPSIWRHSWAPPSSACSAPPSRRRTATATTPGRR